jgi:hypothetical protein
VAKKDLKAMFAAAFGRVDVYEALLGSVTADAAGALETGQRHFRERTLNLFQRNGI